MRTVMSILVVLMIAFALVSSSATGGKVSAKDADNPGHFSTDYASVFKDINNQFDADDQYVKISSDNNIDWYILKSDVYNNVPNVVAHEPLAITVFGIMRNRHISVLMAHAYVYPKLPSALFSKIVLASTCKDSDMIISGAVDADSKTFNENDTKRKIDCGFWRNLSSEVIPVVSGEAKKISRN
jgi:hypothetical protein